MFVVTGKLVSAPNTAMTFYYTGKAGEGYSSVRLCDAFTYNTFSSALVRANNLNLGSSITGIHWQAQEMR
jgi:hypothetical protein